MSNNIIFMNSDVYTYEYFLQDDVCRLCWGRDAKCEILPKSSQNHHKIKNELLDMIMNCLDLDFNDDLHPRKVCNTCYSELKQFHEYKVFCRETDRRLREISLKHSEKNEEDTPFDVKIEKQDEFPDLSATEDVSLTQPDDYLNNLNDSDTAQCKLSENEEVPAKIPVKKRRPKLKRPPTYCKICKVDLETKENLLSHNSTLHGIEEDSTLFKCFGCEKRFKSKKRRLSHEVNFCKGLKDGYKCEKCDRFLPRRRTYETHMRDHREKGTVELPENLFKCLKCYKCFKTRDSLKEHISEHHADKKNFICEICGRVFTRRDYLYKHKLTHSGTKQHVCPHCGFRTAQRSSLTMHIRSKHTGERPYVCDVCPQRCVSSSNLRAHRRRHAPHPHLHYECSICGKKFGYKVSLAEHLSSAHERERRHTCTHCTAAYARPRALRRHLRAKHAADGEAAAENKMAADVYSKMADEGEKKEAEEVKEVAFEVKATEEFILNEGTLVANMF